MASLAFGRIYDAVCSCGEYVGRFQPDIEFALIEKVNFGLDNIKTDDTDLAEILTEMGIMRSCCRRTIMISSISRLLKTGAPFNIYFDQRVLSLPGVRLSIGNPDTPRI